MNSLAKQSSNRILTGEIIWIYGNNKWLNFIVISKEKNRSVKFVDSIMDTYRLKRWIFIQRSIAESCGFSYKIWIIIFLGPLALFNAQPNSTYNVTWGLQTLARISGARCIQFKGSKQLVKIRSGDGPIQMVVGFRQTECMNTKTNFLWF